MNALPIVTLSSLDFEPRQRVPAFEAAAAAICKLAIVPAAADSFASDTTIKILPGAVLAQTRHSACTTTRTRSMAADEGDNLLIHVPLNDGFSMEQQGGPSVECKAGEVYLDPNEVAGRAGFHAGQTAVFYVSIPRSALAQSAQALNGRLRQVMPATPQWRMFIRYAQMLDVDAADLHPDERATCVAHLHELARLALGAADAARLESQGRGLRAARLRALKSEIEAQLTTPGLSLPQLALGQGISERYARALFAEEQTTFRDYVTRRRLQQLQRMLQDAAHDHRSVSDLAMACGFGDLSWFNKCYRQMFGETPSDSRARAQRR